MNQCSQNIPKCLVYPLINNICSMIAAMYVVVGVSFMLKSFSNFQNFQRPVNSPFLSWKQENRHGYLGNHDS